MKKAKKKKEYSLLFLTSVVQICFLACLILVTVAVLFFFYISATKELTAESQSRLATEVRELSARLGEDRRQVMELVQSISDDGGFIFADDSTKLVVAKTALKQSIGEKSVIYGDFDGAFVFKPDAFFVSGSLASHSLNQHSFRDMIETCTEEGTFEINPGEWRLCFVEGYSYLMLSYFYRAADVYIGIGIPVEKLTEKVTDMMPELEAVIVEDQYGVRSHELSPSRSNGTTQISEPIDADGLVVSGVVRLDFVNYLRRGSFSLILLISLLGICLIVVYYNLCRKLVLRPVYRLSKEVQDIADAGYELERLQVSEDASALEIRTLETALNYLLGEVISGRLQLYEKKTREQELSLRQLRSQLRSHFYLNAIMTVNAMLYQNRNEDIREYLALLSDHMRYMMRVDSDMVRLKEELSHIETYLAMQRIRQPDSAVSYIECPEELGNVGIPHLLLYTIVENAFKYAANLIDTLVLYIICEPVDTDEFSGYRVSVEDNGKGFPEEALQIYNSEELYGDNSGQHIGLSNVKRSLYLRYGRKNLMHLENVIPCGANVEILIPVEK